MRREAILLAALFVTKLTHNWLISLPAMRAA